jgi:hypothetical protein
MCELCDSGLNSYAYEILFKSLFCSFNHVIYFIKQLPFPSFPKNVYPIASGASADPTSKVRSSGVAITNCRKSKCTIFWVDPTGIVHTKFHPNSFRNSWLESQEQTDRHLRPALYAFIPCASYNEQENGIKKGGIRWQEVKERREKRKGQGKEENKQTKVKK